MNYQQIIEFHGHECPGLAMGYRMAKAAMNALKSMRSEDEEIVAIVENNACGVDALQCITGCTFGKGNLIFRDFGKHVFTLYSRDTGEGVRVFFHGKGIEPGKSREEIKDFILNADDDELLSVTEVSINEPEAARIHKSIKCDICGEGVMETRIREVDGKKVCIPCAGNNL